MMTVPVLSYAKLRKKKQSLLFYAEKLVSLHKVLRFNNQTLTSMQALILAAGLGTRLRPLTDSKPKALVEIEGRTLLEINIKKLISYGADHIVVNVHHFADKVIDYINSHTWNADIYISDESGTLLDTGGAIAHAISLFEANKPVLIHNVDIISSIDISELLSHHQKHAPFATLAVSKRHTNRQLLFNDNQLIGWHDNRTDQYQWATPQMIQSNKHTELAYSGISVLSWQFIQSLPNATQAYPLVPCLLKAAANHSVIPYEHDAGIWLDVGKPETLALAKKLITK
ncbi:MAG: NTP transferase domain-containing protein [Bacteroidales bacterium]|nr:NTP transferase domain-containing protein [Bacteroidales bacterium]